MSNLWTTASEDAEQADHLKLTSMLRIESVQYWPFLAEAETPGDFENRMALIAQDLDSIVRRNTKDAATFLAARAELEASYAHDFEVVTAARKQAADPGWISHDPDWWANKNKGGYGMPNSHPFWSETPHEDIGQWRVFDKDGQTYGYNRQQNSWYKPGDRATILKWVNDFNANPVDIHASKTSEYHYVKPAGGGKYKIVQKGTGKTLSTHDSKEEAESAFRGMEMHMHGARTPKSDECPLGCPVVFHSQGDRDYHMDWHKAEEHRDPGYNDSNRKGDDFYEKLKHGSVTADRADAENQGHMVGQACRGCGEGTNKADGKVSQRDLGSADKWHRECYQMYQRRLKKDPNTDKYHGASKTSGYMDGSLSTCHDCGNPIRQSQRPVDGSTAWHETDGGAGRNWGDDRDYQCGMSMDSKHHPFGEYISSLYTTASEDLTDDDLRELASGGNELADAMLRIRQDRAGRTTKTDKTAANHPAWSRDNGYDYDKMQCPSCGSKEWRPRSSNYSNDKVVCEGCGKLNTVDAFLGKSASRHTADGACSYCADHVKEGDKCPQCGNTRTAKLGTKKGDVRTAGEGAYVTDAHNSGVRHDVPAGTKATAEQGYQTFMGTSVYDWSVEGQSGDGWQLGGDWSDSKTGSKTAETFGDQYYDPNGKPCSVCGRGMDSLSEFPGDRCISCHANSPEGRAMPTADQLSRMWGGPGTVGAKKVYCPCGKCGKPCEVVGKLASLYECDECRGQ